MTIEASRGTVGTAGTLLYEVAQGTPGQLPDFGVDTFMRVTSGTVFLGGGSTVGTADGYGLVASQPLRVNVDPGESLYGITASGTTIVQILTSTRD